MARSRQDDIQEAHEAVEKVTKIYEDRHGHERASTDRSESSGASVDLARDRQPRCGREIRAKQELYALGPSRA